MLENVSSFIGSKLKKMLSFIAYVSGVKPQMLTIGWRKSTKIL